MISREIIQQTLKCTPSHYPHMIEEKFPHILEKIIKLWHLPEGGVYLADLLQPNGRGGGRMDRDGFPEKVWQEIFKLNELYMKPRPKSVR